MILFDSTLSTFYSTLINDSDFQSGFGTKMLGDARHTATIIDFLKRNAIKYQHLVTLEQIHSANVEYYVKNNLEETTHIEETDGVVTKTTSAILTVQTADCVPIIFADKSNKIIGISHQGWRGSIKRLQQKMILEMEKIGAKKENIRAAIGPTIGECCYNIDEERYHNFLEEFDGFSEKIFQVRAGKRYLNLSRLNFLLLKEIGVSEKNIDYFPFCTSCDQARFFSFRRDKHKEFGEMLSYIEMS